MNTQAFNSNTKGLDYELLDCGNNRKLERFGKIILDRPEVNAFWKNNIDPKLWGKAHFRFEETSLKKGKWIHLKNSNNDWKIKASINEKPLEFHLELTKYKHIGLFPEQYENWEYISNNLKKIKGDKKVLNLFAYTGAANVAAAINNAEVTHIDSIKQVTNWARKNATLNNIDNIRWIIEDARKFVKKAIKRQEVYHGVILDPPTFGFGAKKEVWQIEKDLIPLLLDVKKLLHPDFHFFIMNTYSPTYSGLKLWKDLNANNLLPKDYEYLKLGLTSTRANKIHLGDLLRYSSIE